MGFSLLELIVTISIAAILTAIAIPSFKYVLNDNRMAGEVNDLVGEMQYSRAEAVKEGNDVVVCASNATLNGCSGAPTWQNGWIAFSDPNDNGVLDGGETVLRVHSAFSAGDTFVPSDNLTSEVQFNRDGFAVGLNNAGVTLQLHDSTDNPTYTRCLGVSIVGGLTTVSDGAALPSGGTCQ